MMKVKKQFIFNNCYKMKTVLNYLIITAFLVSASFMSCENTDDKNDTVFIVTFNSNSGSEVAVQIVTEGGKANLCLRGFAIRAFVDDSTYTPIINRREQGGNILINLSNYFIDKINIKLLCLYY